MDEPEGDEDELEPESRDDRCRAQAARIVAPILERFRLALERSWPSEAEKRAKR